jgi:hypothetical protein
MLQRQRYWADDRGIPVDASGYTLILEDNLFRPLYDATRADFEAGSGSELGIRGARGKMQALHSSSALAVNVFDYWRPRNATPLAGALGFSAPPTGIRFEAQYPTGMQGKPPNLDLSLEIGGTTVAIESKFLEPYGRKGTGTPFQDSYFPFGYATWAERNLPSCQELARAMQDGGITFRFLNAAQLLKHVLGLVRLGSGRFALVYLYYAPEGPESLIHASEVAAFAQAVSSDFAFGALTYQELYARLSTQVSTADNDYTRYLHDRYFS